MQDFSMRSLGVGGIIDRAFRLYRNNFKAMVFLSLVIGGSVDLLISVVQLGSHAFSLQSPMGALMRGESLYSFLQYTSFGQSNGLSSILTFLKSLFVTPLVSGGITYVTLSVSHGVTDTEKGYFKSLRGFYDKLIGTSVAVSVVTFAVTFVTYVVLIFSIFALVRILPFYLVAFLFVVPFAFIAPLTAMAFPIAIHEKRYGFRWFKRSWKLLFSKFFKSLAVIILTYIIVFVVQIVLSIVPSLFPPIINSAISVLITALLEPVYIIAVALLYLDIRITKEGYDLELRMAEMGYGGAKNEYKQRYAESKDPEADSGGGSWQQPVQKAPKRLGKGGVPPANSGTWQNPVGMPPSASQPPSGSWQNPPGMPPPANQPPNGSWQNPVGMPPPVNQPPNGSWQNPVGMPPLANQPPNGNWQNPVGIPPQMNQPQPLAQPEGDSRWQPPASAAPFQDPLVQPEPVPESSGSSRWQRPVVPNGEALPADEPEPQTENVPMDGEDNTNG